MINLTHNTLKIKKSNRKFKHPETIALTSITLLIRQLLELVHSIQIMSPIGYEIIMVA